MSAAITTIKSKRKMLLARAGAATLPPITKMAFGTGGVDAGGAVIELTEEQENLKSELYRKDITKYEIVSDTQVTYYCHLSESELIGERISELALVDSEGDIVTIKNFRVKEKDGDFAFTFKINDTM